VHAIKTAAGYQDIDDKKYDYDGWVPMQLAMVADGDPARSNYEEIGAAQGVLPCVRLPGVGGAGALDRGQVAGRYGYPQAREAAEVPKVQIDSELKEKPKLCDLTNYHPLPAPSS
jgi:hypothetical protein